MQDLSVICMCQQKTFSPVLSINSSQKEDFVTSSCISGTACLISCEISLFVTTANLEGILLATYVREFGAARSEELEVNQ